MGQTALETTLKGLKNALLLPIFYAGQIIHDIGGLCRIAPPNFANLLTIVQSDARGGSNKPGRDQQRKKGAHAHPSVLSSRSLTLKNSSQSSLTTKTGLGASHPVDPSPPELITMV